MAAQEPVKPEAPTTTFLRDTVRIDWTEPYPEGSPITGYRIYILESDGNSYSMELSDCDASEATIRDAHSCSVQVSTLINEPFSLTWGSSVVAKVVAYNLYGDSLTSESGNGAVIITYADAPLNLQETVSARTANSITFSWTAGFKNGGSAVTSYRLSYDGASGVYTELASGVAITHYTATGLTAG